MAATSKKSEDDPEKDPYDVLEIPFTASDADVTKAYRKLALKYHPDKQKSTEYDERIALKFREIKEARDFLLDSNKRLKFDAKRRSLEARKAADQAREQQMSAKRKRMRDQLTRQEHEAASLQQMKQKKSESSVSSNSKQNMRNVEELRRQGKELRDKLATDREEQSTQQQQQGATADDKTVPKKEGSLEGLQNRQVRLKWSRKRMKLSPSEHDIANLMSQFGVVLDVQMLGSKGNAALVTFQHESSCDPCVQAYLESEEMRASYVGSRKEREIRKELPKDTVDSDPRRTAESVQDYKLRRATEREQLLRQMELDEKKGQEERFNNNHTTMDESQFSMPKRQTEKPQFPFPPDFPTTEEFQKCSSPYEKLILAEKQVFSQ